MFLISCAPINHHKKVEVAGFEEYVQLFQDYSVQYNHKIVIDDLRIIFGTLNPPGTSSSVTVGLCQTADGTTPEITIDSVEWPDLTASEKEELLMHEMGHCVLYYRHATHSTSIMYPYLADGNVYFDNKDRFLQEFFHPNDGEL